MATSCSTVSLTRWAWYFQAKVWSFGGINGNTKLGALEKKLGVNSLSQVRKKFRKEND